MMKLISVNIDIPEVVNIKGASVLTGIYKMPQIGPTWLGKNSL